MKRLALTVPLVASLALTAYMIGGCGGGSESAALDPTARASGSATVAGSPTAPSQPTPGRAASPASTPVRAASVTAEPTRVTLVAVGDIMLGRSVASSITEADPAAPFAGVQPVLEAAGIAVGNLEAPISNRGSPEPKAYTFRAPVLAARGLATAGFDVLALANNHSLDYGQEALADTLTLLGLEGVLTAGAGTSAEAATTPAFLERGGRRFAFLAFAEVSPEASYDVKTWRATEDGPGIAWLEDALVAEAVAAASAEADFVIVLFHFGFEGWREPSPRQEEAARAAIDAGAALVLGSHPHIVQPVEEYGGGLIAYSLGNFVFDGFEGEANSSAILEVAFEADGSITWGLQPVTIDGAGLPALAR